MNLNYKENEMGLNDLNLTEEELEENRILKEIEDSFNIAGYEVLTSSICIDLDLSKQA